MQLATYLFFKDNTAQAFAANDCDERESRASA